METNQSVVSSISAVQTVEGSLTQRAGRTFASNVLQQGARFTVAIFVTPIIITGLGTALYGAWIMIQQTVGYLALSDLRPMATLKFTLAVNQHVDDIGEKQRQIGASLITWAVTMPIFLILGGLTIIFAPSLIQVSPDQVKSVQIAFGVVLFGVMMERVITLPSMVLRGLNLDYKAMGVNAITILFGGMLSVLAIWSGWGLVGVAISTLVGIVLTNGVRFFVARHVLAWFKAAWPKQSELMKFIKLSAWLFFSALSSLLLIGSDLLVIGFLLGPATAAVYATTGAVLRLSVDPLSNLLSSGSAGLVGLCGRGEWERLETLRIEMHLIALGIMSIIGVGVLALNQSFLQLWVGSGFWGGHELNLILVLIAFGTVTFRVDSILIDGLLEFRSRAWATLVGGLIAIFSGVALINVFGTVGMAVGLCLGYFFLNLYSTLFLSRRMHLSLRRYVLSVLRPATVTAVLLVGAYSLAPLLDVTSWLQFALASILVTLVTGLIMWFLGIPQYFRELLWRRSMQVLDEWKVVMQK